MVKINSLIPELSVSDINRSLDFYLNTLSFMLVYQRKEDKFALLSLNDSRIMIEQINGCWETGILSYPFGRGINFEIGVEDIDKLYESIKKQNYKIKVEMQENWYKANNILIGQKEFLIMDPDGYLLRFAQSLGEKECELDLSSYILKELKLKNGQTLILRKPITEDAKMIVEYLNIVGGESENLLFGNDEFHLTDQMEIEHIKSINESENTLMILGVINNNIVSIAQISSPDRKRITHNSEVAVSVKKDYWKNGIGSSIMEELIRSAKKRGIVKNISLGVKASNKNGIAMYEKFGFKKVGIHKDYFNINGDFDDEILMDLYI